MYCTSNAFLERIQGYVDVIEEKSGGVLHFVEYIPLPYFGNTILRFDIGKEQYTLADLDLYEAFMQDIVQEEFLVDFMGSVYQKVGFEPRMYEEKFRKCYQKYKNVPVTSVEYEAELNNDAAYLLERCGLSPNKKVWEIQLEEETALFLLGPENRKIGSYELEEGTVHVFEVEEIPCVGLMKASMYAKSRHISVVRVLLEA